jgi:hypothetical protein
VCGIGQNKANWTRGKARQPPQPDIKRGSDEMAWRQITISFEMHKTTDNNKTELCTTFFVIVTIWTIQIVHRIINIPENCCSRGTLHISSKTCFLSSKSSHHGSPASGQQPE